MRATPPHARRRRRFAACVAGRADPTPSPGPPMTASDWLHERFEPAGSAIGFRITRKLDEVQSPFQKIEIYESTDWGNVMLIDGAMMVTTRDNFLYHEMMSHPALFTHPDPKQVVIIGGGDCGTLREVLRHPGVERAVQCDIDEQVTRMAEKYFPELCESNDDPRAEILFDDGIAYMANAAPGSLDVVIVDSTDPVGPAEGLFNKAFFESCFRALKDDGILVQQSESPLVLLDLIKAMRAEMGKAGFTSFQTLPFPQPCYPTGWWSCTLARKGQGFEFREADVRAKPFETLYYTAEIHKGAQSLPPFVEQALEG
jgi:spermidine synthase